MENISAAARPKRNIALWIIVAILIMLLGLLLWVWLTPKENLPQFLNGGAKVSSVTTTSSISPDKTGSAVDYPLVSDQSGILSEVCATYNDISICFYPQTRAQYDASSGAISGTLQKAVKNATQLTNWNASQMNSKYRQTPAFIVFATPEEIENVVGADAGAYACFLQVSSAFKLSQNQAMAQLARQQKEGNKCADIFVTTLGAQNAATVFVQNNRSISFVMASSNPTTAFTNEMVHELSHITDFRFELSQEGSVFTNKYSRIVSDYPTQLSREIIERQLQNEKACFGSVLLLSNSVKADDKIIQPYNITDSSSEVFAYSATGRVLQAVSEQLSQWLGRVESANTRQICRSDVLELLNGHVEYSEDVKLLP